MDYVWKYGSFLIIIVLNSRYKFQYLWFFYITITYRFCYICPSCAVAHMLQDVLTLKSPNVTIVFLKLNDLFVKKNNVVINKRFQSLYYCVHNSADVLYRSLLWPEFSHCFFRKNLLVPYYCSSGQCSMC